MAIWLYFINPKRKWLQHSCIFFLQGPPGSPHLPHNMKQKKCPFKKKKKHRWALIQIEKPRPVTDRSNEVHIAAPMVRIRQYLRFLLLLIVLWMSIYRFFYITVTCLTGLSCIWVYMYLQVYSSSSSSVFSQFSFFILCHL